MSDGSREEEEIVWESGERLEVRGRSGRDISLELDGKYDVAAEDKGLGGGAMTVGAVGRASKVRMSSSSVVVEA